MKSKHLAALVAAAAVTLAACGGDDGESTTEAPATTAAPTETSAPAETDAPAPELSGTIVVSGSSTVEPISIAVAEQFAAANRNVDISVDGPGTGDGFKLFCAGETDINDASSKVKDSQLEECAANGIEMIELRIGNDGLTMMTNVNNSAVDCVSFAQIYALTGPESQGFDSWADANALAAELGDTNTLPDAPLSIVGPGEESGTFASFVELVIEEFNEDRGADATTRPDYQASADDNIIIQGIQGSDTSFGWVGFAFAKEAAEVKILQVAEEVGGECVTPTDETIADNSYPVSRPLFIYVNKAKAESNPALTAFVDYYLSDAGIANVSGVGYVSLSDADLQSLRDTWDSRTVFAK
ncbi:MAG: substrate-binding domain-containing protein [Actinomycetota bacterium]|nr:substrate-binding domain-containing protein [Actinomycetota bacterium]MDA2972023.1 substrate-binding domain-containing protein [Actinomycetota bacterium]MDA3000429.1 substrate-binding domain-containing protein [Actinomycetota bacterium]